MLLHKIIARTILKYTVEGIFTQIHSNGNFTDGDVIVSVCNHTIIDEGYYEWDIQKEEDVAYWVYSVDMRLFIDEEFVCDARFITGELTNEQSVFDFIERPECWQIYNVTTNPKVLYGVLTNESI